MQEPTRKKTKKKPRSSPQVFEFVDVEKLRAENPEQAILTVELKRKPQIVSCDLLICGGGMGGVAAAIMASEGGLKVCLTEESSWLGGQMTSQGVSALDENFLVETSGSSRRYKNFRNAIRKHYKALGGKEGTARFEPYLDPGNCWVSRLAFEPKVAVRILSQMLSDAIAKKRLSIFMRSKAVRIRKSRSRIDAVQCVDLDTKKFLEFRCRFCIDATELGDLLPLAGIEYRSGAESRKETGEEHAPPSSNVENVQDFTYPFVLELCPGEDHRIEKPAHYDAFNKAGKFSLQGYAMFQNKKGKTEHGQETEFLPFWEYRRLIASSNFPDSSFPRDIAMINWDSNDLRGENIIDKSADVQAKRLALGKNLSLGFLYWLQNELERDDGGKGYPELKLRSDILGTTDGVSKYPYIRESRRIKAKRTIVETDITKCANPGARARLFKDSLGLGLYPVDIHGKQDVPGAAQSTKPFQIPASALVQTQLKNFLPGCKNIGCTHVSNGAYRLHPIEWSIGEAAAAFAMEVMSAQTDIQRFTQNKKNLRRLQNRLIENGCPVVWFDDINTEDECFAAAQYLGLCALMPLDPDSLSFRPHDHLTRMELAHSLLRLIGLSQSAKAGNSEPGSIQDMKPEDPDTELALICLQQELVKLKQDGRFEPAGIAVREDFIVAMQHKKLAKLGISIPEQFPLSRSQFANWLYKVAKSRKFFGRH